MKDEEVNKLLYEALETEQCGIRIYETALRAVVGPALREEWQEYLEHTRRHASILGKVLKLLELNAEEDTPGRRVVRQIGDALVRAIEMAQEAGPPAAAEIVASECVLLTETKDHHNWELIGAAAQNMTGAEGKALQEAHEAVEDEQDEHLYHTQGWTRELRMKQLGLPAVLPPPEEERDVQTPLWP